MGYVKRIVDKLLKLQDKLYPYVADYYAAGEGRVGLLRVVGVDGEEVLLKCEGGRLVYAKPGEKPHHVFKCTTDTFLSLVLGEEDFREALAKGHLVIESGFTGEVDVVEMEKWARAFERLRHVIRYVAKVPA